MSDYWYLDYLKAPVTIMGLIIFNNQYNYLKYSEKNVNVYEGKKLLHNEYM